MGVNGLACSPSRVLDPSRHAIFATEHPLEISDMAAIVFTTRNGSPGPDLLGPRVIHDSESNTYFIDNVINGLGGDDNIQSIRRPLDLGGQLVNFTVTLNGGAGNDAISGDAGRDIMSGGAGNDTIGGGTDAGTDNMSGGTGVDELNLFAQTLAVDFSLSFTAQAAGPVLLADGSVISGFEKFFVQSGDGDDTFDMSGNANALDSNFQSFEGDDTLIVDSLTRGHIAFNAFDGNDRLIANLSAVTTRVELTAVGAGGSLSTTGLTVAGNDIQIFHVTGGSAADSLTAGDGRDSLAGGAGGDTLNGGGGVDSLAGGADNDTVEGGDGNDRLHGDNGNDSMLGETGSDSLNGGVGSDGLNGGGGKDFLSGNQGGDLFIFTRSSDSPAGAGRDRILDFAQGQDRIDLRAFDADGAPGNGDQRFDFLGASAFTGAGAELRSVQSGGNTIVSGDIDGDRAADFQIQLDGLFTLNGAPGGDFLL